jgi:hypothetical protein
MALQFDGVASFAQSASTINLSSVVSYRWQTAAGTGNTPVQSIADGNSIEEA